MKRLLALITIILLSTSIALSQSRVIVSERNGNITIGEIIEENKVFVRVQKYDDKLIRIIYRSNIESIIPAGEEHRTKRELYQAQIEQIRKEQEIKYKAKLQAVEHKKQTKQQSSAERKQLKEEEKNNKLIEQQAKKSLIEQKRAFLKEPQKGIQQSVELKIAGIGSGANYNVGYRFNNLLYLGAGLGLCNSVFNYDYSNYFSIPLTVNFQAYFLRKHIQPFISISTGYDFHIWAKQEAVYGKWIGSFGLQPGVGVNFRINKKTGIYILFGFDFHFMHSYKHYVLNPSLIIGCSF